MQFSKFPSLSLFNKKIFLNKQFKTQDLISIIVSRKKKNPHLSFILVSPVQTKQYLKCVVILFENLMRKDDNAFG